MATLNREWLQVWRKWCFIILRVYGLSQWGEINATLCKRGCFPGGSYDLWVTRGRVKWVQSALGGQKEKERSNRADRHMKGWRVFINLSHRVRTFLISGVIWSHQGMAAKVNKEHGNISDLFCLQSDFLTFFFFFFCHVLISQQLPG